MIKFFNEYRCYEGKVEVKCDPQLFGKETLELTVMFDSEVERDIQNEINKIEEVKNDFRIMYQKALSELFSWKEDLKMGFEARDDSGRYHKIELNHKDELHKYLGSVMIQLLFYKDDIYVALSFGGDDCTISEDGISAIFLGTDLKNLDATDPGTAFYNNIIYPMENE